ncbi:MAG TPA: outer membrane beta-barrel family protein [Chitinophagaceae bacterium]
MRSVFTLLAVYISLIVNAQPPVGRQGNFTSMNAGHIYGKVVDAKTNKPIDGASLQLTGNRFDSATRKMVPYTLRAGITQPNGDFDFDQLPVRGNLTLRISAIGYLEATENISFGFGNGRGRNGGGVNNPPAEGGDQGSATQNIMNMIDRDLGNIKLTPTEATLENVTVTAVKQLFEMGVDRKVFNVDRNIVSQGQTATEVMKQIPSLSVDIDGNVTMRNATPQLFIDGRPTTLTLDQIPADIIERVELITNPSAQFDASGGNAGILNIVLKKNRRVGYNGGIRSGVDSRGRGNLGGDINLRQGKFNFFLNGMYHMRRSKSWGETQREYLDAQRYSFSQVSEGENEGRMGFIRGGVDFLMDNRNTFTITMNFNRGKFENEDLQQTDTAAKGKLFVSDWRRSNSEGIFKNLGTQLGYKHNFTKPGHELTADLNFNKSNNENNSNIITQSYLPYSNDPRYPYPAFINTMSGGETRNLVMQTDYDNPVTENKKIEFGARASIRDFENLNDQHFINKNYNQDNILSTKYQYTDKVYAAYSIYSFKMKSWSIQLGLRAESSDYNGTQNFEGVDSSFSVKFPVSLFPSAFITKKIDDRQDLQFNYSRRINRPNFFQLIPFVDYSDPNLNVGNPGLKPEFTNSFELSYNYTFNRTDNFLASVFAKQNNDLITRYQYYGRDSLLFNTYINANSSFTFGVELTQRFAVMKPWETSINFNLFNSKLNVNSTDGKSTITNQLTSWFVKWNNTIKLGQGVTAQLSADYYAKTVLPGEGGRGGGGRGGMMYGGGQQTTAQGYIKPRYSVDLGIRKEWALKGGNTVSLGLNMNDILRTQVYSTHSESPFFIQDSERRRDPQVLRLNLQWRFGKFDPNLFKRRNNRQPEDDSGMMGGM